MGIPNGMIKKMTGSAGQLAFKTVNAQTVVSESFIPNQTLDCYAQTYAPLLESSLLSYFGRNGTLQALSNENNCSKMKVYHHNAND